ncbi:MAG: Uma2 family endonuclease [Isosphaeraceae bacterium]|nr:Uma2 family endonuclease [Isosphaeraceae bacterium]
MSASPAISPTRATVNDLQSIPGKAELIGGRIVEFMPSGHRPNVVAGRIYRKIAEHADERGEGVAYTDNMGFVVPLLRSGRQSFSPDASFYLGTIPPDSMRFVTGPPDFDVEVRSENDYGDAAESALAAKRDDYFAAGTKVVWDVDPIAGLVRVYRPSAPGVPVTFGRGDWADAEPVLSGWRVALDWIFA